VVPPQFERFGAVLLLLCNWHYYCAVVLPQFECFGAVLRSAANWMRAQQRVRVTNVQSIDYKLKHEAGSSLSTSDQPACVTSQ